jgi:hypothetical protein
MVKWTIRRCFSVLQFRVPNWVLGFVVFECEWVDLHRKSEMNTRDLKEVLR